MPSNYQGSPIEVEALSAFINLMRASDSVATALQKDFDLNDLTTSQFAVLEALFHLGPLFQGEIAQKLLRCTGSITSVVAGLGEKGRGGGRGESHHQPDVRVWRRAHGKKSN